MEKRVMGHESGDEQEGTRAGAPAKVTHVGHERGHQCDRSSDTLACLT